MFFSLVHHPTFVQGLFQSSTLPKSHSSSLEPIHFQVLLCSAWQGLFYRILKWSLALVQPCGTEIKCLLVWKFKFYLFSMWNVAKLLSLDLSTVTCELSIQLQRGRIRTEDRTVSLRLLNSVMFRNGCILSCLFTHSTSHMTIFP